MTTFERFCTALAVCVFAIAIGACSDDDSGPTGTGNDTTPPSVATVTAIDANHVDVRFSEAVDRETAENETYYTILETGTPIPAPGVGTAPGDPISVTNASLRSDGRTVAITTGDAMSATGYRVSVVGVEDVHGNDVTTATEKQFSGSAAADDTPAEIVDRAPGGNTTNVDRNTAIHIEFSEPVQTATFENAFALTTGGNETPVVITSEDETHFSVDPVAALNNNALYTVALTGVMDLANNMTPNVEWSFHTEATTDNTPPTLVTSVPANDATNVNVSTNISMTFSEAIDQQDFVPVFAPGIGEVTPEWSNEGKTVTYNPNGTLTPGAEYAITFLPGALKDLAGNSNGTPISITFNTAPATNMSTGVENADAARVAAKRQ